MDRNTHNFAALHDIFKVALRKESVDRNSFGLSRADTVSRSLSARRAWIEIPITLRHCTTYLKSLSARRAWIEILLVYLALIRYLVALRKESVDRNADTMLNT